MHIHTKIYDVLYLLLPPFSPPSSLPCPRGPSREAAGGPPGAPKNTPRKHISNMYFFFVLIFYDSFSDFCLLFLAKASSPRNPPRGGPQRRPPEEAPRGGPQRRPHGCSTVLTLLTLLRVLTLLRMCSAGPPRPVPRKQPHITPHIYCTYLVRPGPPGGFLGD